jgi:hypothetical protein
MAFAHPQGQEDVAAIVERLEAVREAAAVGGLPSREEMSRQALAWLGRIAAREDTFYEVQRYEPAVLEATEDLELLAGGLFILAYFPSHEGQQRLVNVVSSDSLPIELRQKAAEAFRASVQRHGVQLTSGEVLDQYDRYNASETADRAVQQTLSHVLDTIEAGRAAGP